MQEKNKHAALFVVYFALVALMLFTFTSMLFAGIRLMKEPSPPVDLQIPNVTMAQFVAVVMFIWPLQYVFVGGIFVYCWVSMKRYRFKYMYRLHEERVTRQAHEAAKSLKKVRRKR